MRKIVRIAAMLFLCVLLVQPVQAANKDITVKSRIRDDKVYLLIKDSESSEKIDTNKLYKILFMVETEYDGKQVWLCTSEYDRTGEELQPYLNKNDVFDTEEDQDIKHIEDSAIQIWEKDGNEWTERSDIDECNGKFSDGEKISVSGNSNGETAKYQDYILMESENIILPLNLAESLYGVQVKTDMQGQVTEVLDDRGDFIDAALFCAGVDGLSLEKEAPLPTPKPTATATPKPTATATPEPTATVTPKPTATATPEPTATVTPKPTATATPEPTATVTPEPTATATPEPTATVTPKPTVTATPEPTATVTPKSTATATPEPTVTATPTKAAVLTSEPSDPDSPSKKGPGGTLFVLIAILLGLGAAIVYFLHRSKKKGSTDRTEFNSSSEDTLNPPDSDDTIRPVETATAAPARKASFTVQSAVINNKGRVRKNNEDNFCLNGTIMQREKMDCGANISSICKEPVQLYAVCDGMGGADNGEDASYTAVKLLSERKRECGRWNDQAEFTKVLRSISDRIYRQSEQKGKKSGTTIVAMVLNRDKLTLVNVGDSRIYRLRKHKLEQISLDHSKVQRMISMGVLTPDQAKTHPDRHVITQYLGMPSDVRISPYYAVDSSVKENDIYLMCSDGLTDMVEDKKIAEILNAEPEPRNAAQRLVKSALEHGGRDNVTVMILRIVKDSEGKKGM